MIKINKIIRSRRKTIALQINEKAEVVVRAQRFSSTRRIERLVRKKYVWVKQKQAEIRKQNAKRKAKKYQTGEKFIFLGRYYPLTLAEKGRPAGGRDLR